VTSIPVEPYASDADGAGWPHAYRKAIAQIACPAYCCTPAGAVLHCNGAARRLWGGAPSSAQEGCWDGFAALYRTDGTPVAKASSPAALAARTGVAPPSTELVAEAANGERRCLVVHARPVAQADGATVGVLCTLTDISVQRDLEQAARLVSADREAFLRMLAHELRNPLSSVMSVAAFLRRQPDGADVARMAGVIERQTGQLARFIGDLLDAARIEHACDIPVALRESTVGGVLQLVRDVTDGVMRGRGQTLSVAMNATDAVLWCDPDRLAQALGNALLNASEFSDDGAGIAMAVAIDGTLLEVHVTDSGIGVEGDALLAMFEPFRKCGGHPGRVDSGAGLGLAIARSICRAHGGMVSAHSAGRGTGTRLRFMLPVVQAAGARPAGDGYR